MDVLRVFFFEVSLNLLNLIPERSVGFQQICHCVDTMNQAFGLCLSFLMKITSHCLTQRITSNRTPITPRVLYLLENFRQSPRSTRCLEIIPPLCLRIGEDVVLLCKLGNFARQLLKLLIFFLLQNA